MRFTPFTCDYVDKRRYFIVIETSYCERRKRYEGTRSDNSRFCWISFVLYKSACFPPTLLINKHKYVHQMYLFSLKSRYKCPAKALSRFQKMTGSKISTQKGDISHRYFYTKLLHDFKQSSLVLKCISVKLDQFSKSF